MLRSRRDRAEADRDAVESARAFDAMAGGFPVPPMAPPVPPRLRRVDHPAHPDHDNAPRGVTEGVAEKESTDA
jgi:NADH-quinone oxidoreductase subunit H